MNLSAAAGRSRRIERAEFDRRLPAIGRYRCSRRRRHLSFAAGRSSVHLQQTVGRRTVSLLRNDIDLAIERIAEFIGDFSRVTIEQQVTNLTEAAASVGNADSPLAAVPGFII